MKPVKIKEKVLKGGKLAIDRLLDKKQKENSYIVISKRGKVVRLNARDLKR